MKKKTFKSFLYDLFLVFFIINLLCSCSELAQSDGTNSNSPQSLPNGISEFDEESRYIPMTSGQENSSSESSSEHEEPGGGFLVKNKKYHYDGNDIIVLSVENQSNANYSLTITGFYLDKGGNKLKEETQTFKDFASGYQNYFLFQPQISFETFTYELNAVEFEGECLSANLSHVWLGELIPHKGVIQERMLKGDFTEYPCLLAKVGHSNENECRVAIDETLIFLTESGDVYKIMKTGTSYMNAGVMNDYTTYDLYYEMTDAERVEIPSELQGEFSILIAIHSVEEDKKG